MTRKSNHLVEYQKEIKRKGMEAVREYYRTHPFTSGKQCARDLGMKYQTVASYIREMRAERNS